MRLLTIPLALLASFALPAQEGGDGTGDPLAAMMTPAKESKLFDVMLGSWKGKGTAKETADGESMAWVSEAFGQRVLGGHFVRQDVVMRLAAMDEDDSPMVMRSWNGFDRETKKHMHIGMANDGSVTANRVWFVGKDTMTLTHSFQIVGKTFVDRWVSKFKKNSYTLRGFRSIDGGKEFEHMRGDFERVKQVTIPDFTKLPTFMPGAKPLKIKGLAAKYQMTGSMVPAPGAPEVPIAATDHGQLLFSDTVLQFTVKGKPSGGFAYGGVSVIAWDTQNDAHKMIWVNNMGEIGHAPVWVRDGKFLSVWSGVRMGQPTATRTVGTLRDDGSFEKIVTHSAIGTNPPVKYFTGTYEKVK